MDKPASPDYPIHDLISRRWSPRAMEARPVAAEQLRSLLEAVRWSASSFNEQPWRILIARREDGEAFETMLGCLMEANRVWACNAGALLITVAKRNFSRNDKPNRVALHDIGLAAGSLSLQATDLGLVVHQMAGVDLDRVRETYAIPDGFDPVTAIAVGHPGSVEQLPEALQGMETAERTRMPQESFVFEHGWGEAARF